MNRSIYRWRRATAAIALLMSVGVVAYATASSSSSSSRTNGIPSVRFESNGRFVAAIDLDGFDLKSAGEVARLRQAIVNALPASEVRRVGKARLTTEIDSDKAAADALRLGGAGGSVNVRTRPVAVTISAPVIKQRLRNNCEATALEVLLESEGVRASQLTLQNQLDKDGPLDPRGNGSTKVWGDPDSGFVGRADGGGPAGGFGVYPQPIRALAARYKVPLEDLTGRPATQIYRKLYAGHAVMAWVGLAQGPFETWRTTSGKQVEVNLNEHTVVLSGISRSGALMVVDPLTGSQVQWSRKEFEEMWKLLGSRAVSA